MEIDAREPGAIVFRAPAVISSPNPAYKHEGLASDQRNDRRANRNLRFKMCATGEVDPQSMNHPRWQRRESCNMQIWNLRFLCRAISRNHWAPRTPSLPIPLGFRTILSRIKNCLREKAPSDFALAPKRWSWKNACPSLREVFSSIFLFHLQRFW